MEADRSPGPPNLTTPLGLNPSCPPSPQSQRDSASCSGWGWHRRPLEELLTPPCTLGPTCQVSWVRYVDWGSALRTRQDGQEENHSLKWKTAAAQWSFGEYAGVPPLWKWLGLHPLEGCSLQAWGAGLAVLKELRVAACRQLGVGWEEGAVLPPLYRLRIQLAQGIDPPA